MKGLMRFCWCWFLVSGEIFCWDFLLFWCLGVVWFHFDLWEGVRVLFWEYWCWGVGSFSWYRHVVEITRCDVQMNIEKRAHLISYATNLYRDYNSLTSILWIKWYHGSYHRFFFHCPSMLSGKVPKCCPCHVHSKDRIQRGNKKGRLKFNPWILEITIWWNLPFPKHFILSLYIYV